MSATEPRRDRFLTPAMAATLAGYGIVAASFARFQIKNDGASYFYMMQRFFGEHPDYAFAYQFGSDVWNAPFFLVGKLFSSIWSPQPHNFHVSFEEISITIATQVAFVVTLYLGWLILRELDLPRNPAILMLTAFGSPLYYYVIFEPAYKHAVDTLFLSLAVLLLLRASRRVDMRDAVWLGAVAGVSFNIRWANAPFYFVLLVAAVLAGRKRQAVVGLGFALLVGTAISVLPALRGIDYFVPSYFPKSHGAVRNALGLHGIVAAGGTSNPLNGFDPLIPLKMLFSFHRGLFIWTPLTAAATLGFVLAVHRMRRTPFFGPLLTLGVAAVVLLLDHIVWGDWDGGFSFSSRFLTGLFPFFLIGMAELVRRQAVVAYAIAVAGAAFAVSIGFVHEIGYDGISARDGIGAHLRALADNRGNYRHKVRLSADNRWDYLWAVLRGEGSRTP